MNNQLKLKKLFLFISITLLLTNSIFADIDDTKRHPIPAENYRRCEKAGTTTLFQYAANGQKRTAVVYLPYGYSEEDKDTRYPVLYLMHGGGGTASSYLGTAQSPNQLCWIIDNSIEKGEIKPLIIVCPNNTGAFPSEFRNYLVSAVDKAYNTIPDRNYRAFGGFSMGSVATWQIFQHSLDLVRNFIPMSGDSWICGSTGGRTFPDETARALTRVDFIDTYKNDFQIFAATGTSDTAYPNMTPQINSMKNESSIFKYTTENFSSGNLIYYVVQGNVHSYTATYEYVYNALRGMF